MHLRDQEYHSGTHRAVLGAPMGAFAPLASGVGNGITLLSSPSSYAMQPGGE